jgi:guanine deaminase
MPTPQPTDTAPTRWALKGDLLDLLREPGLGAPDESAVRWRPGHWLLVDEGRIQAIQAEPPGDDFARIDCSGQLVLPGFIDTHVHSPQLDVIASFGSGLLDWLATYTFPAEAMHAEPAYAQHVAEVFVQALLAHGSTAAVVFPTVHRASTEALLQAAHQRGMRLIAGKVMMDRNAPQALCDSVASAEADSRALIAAWHGRGRIAYALTPRFAGSSTPAQLALAGRLSREHPGTYIQTHVAETQEEVAWVAGLYPESRSYLDVYAQHGLLHERTVLAHGIWLDDTDRRVLADTGAHIAHSPGSNLFLGSGLMDWRALQAAGVPVSLASDVGGGTSLCAWRSMADAYKVQALRGERLNAYQALHAATLGAARALRLDSEIGRLEPGCAADLAVWDWAVGPVATHRQSLARSLHERLFALMMLGDERNLAAAWVAGRRQYLRPAPPASA